MISEDLISLIIRGFPDGDVDTVAGFSGFFSFRLDNASDDLRGDARVLDVVDSNGSPPGRHYRVFYKFVVF